MALSVVSRFSSWWEAKFNCFVWFCFGFFVPLENISLICRRHHCRWRAPNFDLCSALMAIEQWGFVSVPHLRHGASVYNGHLCDIHTYCLALSSGATTTCFYELGLSRLEFVYPTFRWRGERSSPLNQRRGFNLRNSRKHISPSMLWLIIFNMKWLWLAL